MTTTNAHKSAVSLQRRNVCGVLVLSCLGVATTAGAETSAPARPALERFIQVAQLQAQSRLWAKNYVNIAKLPSHPLHGLVEKIQSASDAELLALLVQTFQSLAEEDAQNLATVLEEPLGQWIVQSALWAQEFASRITSQGMSDQGRARMPRKLSDTEIHAIKAIGATPSWQALRRTGQATRLGVELLIPFDWPQFVDLLQSR